MLAKIQNLKGYKLQQRIYNMNDKLLLIVPIVVYHVHSITTLIRTSMLLILEN